jgi:hypothetical protein
MPTDFGLLDSQPEGLLSMGISIKPVIQERLLDIGEPQSILDTSKPQLVVLAAPQFFVIVAGSDHSLLSKGHGGMD